MPSTVASPNGASRSAAPTDCTTTPTCADRRPRLSPLPGEARLRFSPELQAVDRHRAPLLHRELRREPDRDRLQTVPHGHLDRGAVDDGRTELLVLVEGRAVVLAGP